MPEKSLRHEWGDVLQDAKFHSFSLEQKMEIGRYFAPNTSDDDLYKLIGGYEEKFGKRGTASSLFKESFGRTFAETAPETGAALGGAIGSIPGLAMSTNPATAIPGASLAIRGGVAGSAAGTYGGAKLKEYLQATQPNLFGDPSLDPALETAQDVAIDIGISAATAGVGKFLGLSATGMKVAKDTGIPYMKKLLGSPVIGHWLKTAGQELDGPTLRAILKYSGAFKGGEPGTWIPNSFAQMTQSGANLAGAMAQRPFRNLSQSSFRVTMKGWNRLIEAETRQQGGVFEIATGKNPLLSDVTLGKKIQNQILGFRKIITEMAGEYYTRISKFANEDVSMRKFTQTIPATMKKSKDKFSGELISETDIAEQVIPKEIQGPVFANKFAANLEGLQKMLDDLSSNDAIIASGKVDIVKQRFATLTKFIKNLQSQSEGVIKDESGKVMKYNMIMSYDDANEIRKAIGELSKYDQVNPSFVEGGFRGLYHDLRSDILESMSSSNWGHKKIGASLERAFDLTIFKYDIGKPTLLTMVKNNNSTGIINYITGSSGNAKEIVEMLGGRPPKHLLKSKTNPKGLVGMDVTNKYGRGGTGNVEVQARYMRHLIESTRKTADETWNASAAYEKFDNTEAGIIAEIFPNAVQRGNIRQFLKAAQHTAEVTPQSGNTGLQFRKGSFLVMALAKRAYGGIGLGVLIGAEDFVGKVLLNKRLGRQAAQMLHTGSDTEIATRWSRDTFLALKGIQISIQTGDKVLRGRIDENGIPRIDPSEEN